ncbi:inovirus Gp2 family protein [Acinetobacter gyllenbergii]|uniref:inovirus Gp2 family protein n=1 Tax=Acinetobacter gyllenbergii TaxID=134534 RepID=UPI0021D28379|nr:inovirus Gp2 family protein [Acinetobacter gyllenbergii]MCU4582485.1 inovirus Gp2 family protein [Acinetobacter gyllenbergii]
MKNEILAVMTIEQLLQDVARIHDQVQYENRKKSQLLRCCVQRCCELMPAFLELKALGFQLQFPVSLFRRVVPVIQSICQRHHLNISEIHSSPYWFDVIKVLYIGQREWELDRKAFYVQEINNYLSMETYLREVLQRYCKSLIVRVDLKYKQEVLSSISIAEVHLHISKLLKRISDRDTCFKGLIGYAWALEQGGESGGYHIHLLLIYKGFEHQHGWYFADQVSKLWNKITENRGCHFNLHDVEYRKRYIENGTDGLDKLIRGDESRLQNVLRLGLYLTCPTKYDQRLRIKKKRMRTFDHGQRRPELLVLSLS